MSRCAIPPKIVRTGFLLSCIFLANLPTQLLATQLHELRLFHEPFNVDMDLDVDVDMGANVDTALTEARLMNACRSQADISEFRQPENQADVQASGLKLPVTAVPPADNIDTGETNAYQYNGFISTAVGQHFLINGTPLSDIDALVFVSVKHGGRSLVLKTPKGRTFELSVGQSISKDSL